MKDGEMDLARNINLSLEEAEKFSKILDSISEVLDHHEFKYANLDKLNNPTEVKIPPVPCWGLRYKKDSKTFVTSLFLSIEDARMALAAEKEKEKLEIYDCMIECPERCAVVAVVLKNVIAKRKSLAATSENVTDREILANVKKGFVTAILLVTLKILGYSWPLFCSELIEAYIYCGGLEKEYHSVPTAAQIDQQRLIQAAYDMALMDVNDDDNF
jgi:hypothetical protein